MDYNFTTLNSRDFEHLIQSISQKLLGKNSIVFGDGPDGARELTYQGVANFPNELENWDGYWIIQAKYKTRDFEKVDDYDWIKREFEKEMSKFQNKDRKLEIPNNYIFFTNAVLTAVHNVGGRDKIETLKKKYTTLIPNIQFVAYDDLCRILDNNRDVATTYSSFILSGDILSKLYSLLEYEQQKKTNTQNLFLNYLEKTFLSEMYSKLIQAGDLTNQINIEKVFIDIDVVNNSNPNERIKFLERLIKLGNYKWSPQKSCKMVLVGGAGSGKSTLSQFASQIYSAFFISDNKKEDSHEKIKEFIHDYSICNKPECLRFPFKVILKDFATWIKEQNENGNSKSVLNYIKHRIEIIGDGNIDIDIAREFLSKVSSFIIFDGLDEVPITSNRSEVLKEINDFIDVELKNLKADSVILCTTRQQGYTKEFDENSFTHFYVSELNDDDCLLYLTKLLDNIENSFDDKLHYLNTLKDAILDEVAGRLMRTPLQATIMTILVKSGGKPSRNKYNLFKEYYETIYKRELQKEFLPILKDYKRNIDDIHALLGFELQVKSEGKDNPSALYDKKEFEELIRLYLKQNEEWEDKDIDGFLTIITRAVTERLVFICEIQDEKIGFIIRSLQEYFAANYIINYCDESVNNYIKEIANNSYWRNTFLFAVSGLHNTKRHLIDQVYLHCERLNGNEDDINIRTLSNTLFCGSWIALDILTEGIFADSPRNRNRFLSLLDKLFSSPTIGELSKFELLSNEALIDIVINKYIRNCLFSEKKYIEKYTSYRLAFLLLKNKHLYPIITDILNKTWLEEYELNLISLIFELKNFEIDFLYERLYVALLKEDYLKYKEILEIDVQNNYVIINNIIDKYKQDDKLIRNLLELIFLILLNSRSNNKENNIFSILNKLDDSIQFMISKSFMWTILDNNYNKLGIEVVKDYSINITSIKSIDKNLTPFSNLFKKYSINYLYSYVNFIKSPNSDNLKQFLDDLFIYNNNKVLELLFMSSRLWLFKELAFLKDVSEIKTVPEFLRKNKFGDDYLQWENFEETIIKKNDFNYLFKYVSLFTISNSNYHDLFILFFKKYRNELISKNKVIIYEFIRLFAWIFSEREESNSYVFSVEIIDEVLESFNSLEMVNSNIYLLRHALIGIIINLDVTHFERIKSYQLKVFDYETENLKIKDVMTIDSVVLDKLILFFNNYDFFNKTENFEQLILHFICTGNEIEIEDVSKIQFNNIKLDDRDYSYRLILKLISNQFDKNEIDIIISRIIEDPNSIKMVEIISDLFLKLKINENWCVEFFIKLFSILMVKEVNITTIIKIEQYLKFTNENRLTNMIQLQLC